MSTDNLPDPPPRKTPWQAPRVKEALRTRQPHDITIMECPRCSLTSHYNDGSHFTCEWCYASYSGGELDMLIESGHLQLLSDWEEDDEDLFPEEGQR
jgi:hypothetical protein